MIIMKNISAKHIWYTSNIEIIYDIRKIFKKNLKLSLNIANMYVYVYICYGQFWLIDYY